MSITEEYNIKKILFSRYNTLGKLCQASKKLNDLNTIVIGVITQIHAEIINYCRVNNYQDNRLIIETSRSEFLTALKFRSTDIMSMLRQHPEFSNLITIKYKINPAFENNPQKINTPAIAPYNKPNVSAKQKLQTIADTINDSTLKQALLRLINDASS